MKRVNGELATEYQTQYKKLSKVQKLEVEIENFQNRINEYQARIDYLTPMTQYAYPPYKEELLVELGKHPGLGFIVRNDYKWEDVDQTMYTKTKEEWELGQQQLITECMISMIERDVDRPKGYIKDFEKKILKLQAKIESLTIS